MHRLDSRCPPSKRRRHVRERYAEVESSHVVMLSQPEFVLDVIRDAAAAIQKDAVAASPA